MTVRGFVLRGCLMALTPAALRAQQTSSVTDSTILGLYVDTYFAYDAGIFFSHMGNESWISRDNPTYTRSWVAEFSPYYESGVRATWTAPPAARLQLTPVNGWQNISETNSSKAIGVRFEYTLSPSVVFSYDNFIGNEAPDSAASRVGSSTSWAFALARAERSSCCSSRSTVANGVARVPGMRTGEAAS